MKAKSTPRPPVRSRRVVEWGAEEGVEGCDDVAAYEGRQVRLGGDAGDEGWEGRLVRLGCDDVAACEGRLVRLGGDAGDEGWEGRLVRLGGDAEDAGWE
jgi:hypothetical protein